MPLGNIIAANIRRTNRGDWALTATNDCGRSAVVAFSAMHGRKAAVADFSKRHPEIVTRRFS